MQQGTSTLVSVDDAGLNGGTNGGNNESGNFSFLYGMSQDGSTVTFVSHAPDLVPHDNNAAPDIFQRNVPAQATTLVTAANPALPDVTGAGYSPSSSPSVSADGRYVAFVNGSPGYYSQLVGIEPLGQQVYVRDLQTQTTVLASVDLAGTGEGNDACYNPVISADGRMVLFESGATNLVGTNLPADGGLQMFVRDLQTGVTSLVSATPDGTKGCTGGLGGEDAEAAISADDRYVVFQSTGTDLTANDAIGGNQLFVRDLQAGITTLVSVNSAGTDGTNIGNAAYDPQISANGQFVVFQSAAADLAAGGGSSRFGANNVQVFVRDLQAGVTRLVSVDNTGAEADYPSNLCSTTPDGRYVTFQSAADNLTPPGTPLATNLFVRDLQAGTTTQVNAGMNGVDTLYSEQQSISADGRFITFQRANQDYVRDMLAGTTTALTVDPSRTGLANSASYPARISADGQFVLFESDATNLVSNNVVYLSSSGTVGPGIQGYQHLFVRDLHTGVTKLVDLTADGAASADADVQADFQLSADGSSVVFTSGADNLVNKFNGSTNVFAYSTAFFAIPAGVLKVSATPIHAVEGTAFSGVVASFTDTDGDPAGSYAAAIDWSDGSTSPGTITPMLTAASASPGPIRSPRPDSIPSMPRSLTTTAAARASVPRWCKPTPPATFPVPSRSTPRPSRGRPARSPFNSIRGRGPAPSRPWRRISNLVVTGGSLTSAVTNQGGASGALTGTAQLANSAVLNEILQGITFGSSVSFEITISGAAVEQPGNGDFGSTFAVQLLGADGVTPQATIDPSGAVNTVDVNPDGSSKVTSFSSSAQGGPPVAKAFNVVERAAGGNRRHPRGHSGHAAHGGDRHVHRRQSACAARRLRRPHDRLGRRPDLHGHDYSGEQRDFQRQRHAHLHGWRDLHRRRDHQRSGRQCRDRVRDHRGDAAPVVVGAGFDLSGNRVNQVFVGQKFNVQFSALAGSVLDTAYQGYLYVYNYGYVYLSAGSGWLNNVSFPTTGSQTLTFYDYVSGRYGTFSILVVPDPVLVLTGAGLDIRAVAATPFTGLVASLADSNPATQAGGFTASIAWGDGTSSAGTVTADGKGGFDVSGTRTYASAGTYPISVTASDGLGNSLTLTAGGAWIAAAPLLEVRDSMSAVAGADGRIYVLGGYNPSNQGSAVDAYDPGSNAWSTVTDLPAAGSEFAVTAGRDGRIYVLGGYDSSSNVSAQAEVYDPASNLWTTLPPLPTPLVDAAAATGPDGRIYVLGGYDSNFNPTAGVEVYDPSLNAWSAGADMLSARVYVSAVTGADGRIYALGGYDANNVTLAVDAYDPGANTWTNVTNLPASLSGFAVSTRDDGRIYVLGGYDNTKHVVTAHAEAYDPAGNSWTTLADMSAVRVNFAAATLPDGRILALGGQDNNFTPLATVEAWSDFSGTATVAPAGTLSPTTIRVNPVTVPYNGRPHSATAEVYGPDNLDLGPATITDPQGAGPVDAGTYSVTASFAGNSGYAADTVTVPGAITITPAVPAVTAGDDNTTYSGLPQAYLDSDVTVIGANGLDSSGGTLSYTYDDSATVPTAAGSYTVVATFTPNNATDYSSATGTATWTISKAPLTITASAAGRTYGDPNPAFSGTIVGIKNGDAITATYSTSATAASPVGPYNIVPAAVDSAPSTLGNYCVTLVNGTLTVGKAPLTITASAAGRTYGDPNPAFSGTIVGIKNGDAITATYSTSATAASPVGPYNIVPAAVDSAPSTLGNYSVTLVNGTLTVGKAALDDHGQRRRPHVRRSQPGVQRYDRGHQERRCDHGHLFDLGHGGQPCRAVQHRARRGR